MIREYLISGLVVLLSVGCSSALRLEDIPKAPEDGELWAVLVAGSNGWYNYRHQADVCHAYQVVHSHGIPDDHIIVMMYDDIANNPENPTPGKIINHPNGTDVYAGVPKDYTCNAVRPDLFLKVLRGEEINEGSGKTLKSTEKDHVFVYFADHGAKGLLGFGQAILKSDDLHDAIKDMFAKKMYGKLVFYIEACESGSMFEGFLDGGNDAMNVFATTASNATTSSYACYYDPARKTFLGDVYSIKWLEDSDKEDLEKETLEEQYKIVKKETNTSTVCQFGDMSISKMPVGMFQGESMADINPVPVPPSWLSCGRTAVSGPEVPVEILTRVLSDPAVPADQKQQAQMELAKIQSNRKFMMQTVEDLVNLVLTVANGDVVADEVNHVLHDNVPLKEHHKKCYFAAVDEFHATCFNLGMNDYALRMTNTLVNLCDRKYHIQTIIDAIKIVCSHPPVYGIH